MLATAPITFPLMTRSRPVETHMERCLQDGRTYPSGECPCWTNLAPSRARELRRDLDSWFAGFKARHPEFALR